jgi:AraC-like DNA-binding protein
MRHDILREYDPKPGSSISTLAYEYPRGFDVPEHAHGSDQLIYAVRGLMEVSASRKLWLIPPHLGIWIPARTLHRVRMPNRASMRTLYFREGLVRRSPTCAVLHVSSLLRELILEAVRLRELRAGDALHRSLRDLIAAQLRSATEVPISVSLPTDPRALRFAQDFISTLENSTLLTEVCRIAGASVRTMERIFQREVGMSLESWRRQVRLMKAVELLVEGCPVKKVAAEVGYRQPSAFIELFRQTLGVTPKAWTSAALGKSEA